MLPGPLAGHGPGRPAQCGLHRRLFRRDCFPDFIPTPVRAVCTGLLASALAGLRAPAGGHAWLEQRHLQFTPNDFDAASMHTRHVLDSQAAPARPRAARCSARVTW